MFPRKKRLNNQLAIKAKIEAGFVSNWCLFSYEIIVMIFSYLDRQSLISLRQTCWDNKAAVKEVMAQKFAGSMIVKPRTVFYAVGSEIPLYANASSFNHWAYQYERETTNEDLAGAIYGRDAILFAGLKDAITYSKDTCTYKYHHSDTFMSISESPIYVVKVKDTNQLYKKEETLQVSRILDYPNPPDVTTKKMITYSSKIDNVQQIFFAKCMNKFYEINSPVTNKEKLEKAFTRTWDAACAEKKSCSIDAKVSHCLSELFKSYSIPIYSFFTRHNQPHIRSLLEKLKQSTSLADFHDFLKEKYNEAYRNPAIIKEGHYFNMLKFANEKMYDLQELKKLDVDTYLKCRC